MNNFLSFQVHGVAGSHSDEGVAAGVGEILTFIENLLTLSPTEALTVLMPGIAAMENIHPMVVHFPIAFLFTFLIVDLFGTLTNKDDWRFFASGLLYLGVFFSGLAVLAGFQAEESVKHGSNVHEIMETHEMFGLSVLGFATILAIWRFFAKNSLQGANNALFLTLAIILNILLMLGADLGGFMVYKHGVAVEAVEQAIPDNDHQHVHPH